jgi:hypothetical protein
MKAPRSDTGLSILLGLTLVVQGTACSSVLGPYERDGIHPAWIAVDYRAPEISLPDSVRAGQSFPLTVVIYFGSWVTEGGTRITYGRQRIDVYPLNEYHPGQMASDFLMSAPRTIVLKGQSVGVLTVRVHGTRVIAVPDRAREAITVTREVRVW